MYGSVYIYGCADVGVGVNVSVDVDMDVGVDTSISCCYIIKENIYFIRI